MKTTIEEFIEMGRILDEANCPRYSRTVIYKDKEDGVVYIITPDGKFEFDFGDDDELEL